MHIHSFLWTLLFFCSSPPHWYTFECIPSWLVTFPICICTRVLRERHRHTRAHRFQRIYRYFFLLFHFILCLASLKVFRNLINLQLWLFVRGDRGRFVFKSRASIPRTSGLMCQQRWCSKKQKSSKPKNVYFIYSRMPNLVYYYTHQRPSEHIYYESFSQWINSGTDVSLAR